MNCRATHFWVIRLICIVLFLVACDLATIMPVTGLPTPTIVSILPAITPTSIPITLASATIPPTVKSSTAVSAGPITVNSPNGGEIWTVGQIHPIHWDWSGRFSAVRLEYSSDGGNTWRTIAANTENNGAYLWTVPGTPCSACKVKITNTTDPNAFDMSDVNFAIVLPTITVARPNGGETYVAGETRPIHWDWTGRFSGVRLEYSTDSGATWRTIAQTADNDGAFAWNVPNTLSPSCRLKVTDAADPNAFGISQANFTIGTRASATPILLTSPISGDTFVVGRDRYLTWVSSPGIREVKIEYSANGGSTWDMISASTTNDGGFKWKIPNTPCTNCKVKISDVSNPSTFATGDAFTIAAQTLALTSPRAVDSWVAGRRYYITWNWTGGMNMLKLEYSTNGGSTWDLITATTTNDGGYLWQVPNKPSSNVLVKITNTENTQVFNVSPGFEIR